MDRQELIARLTECLRDDERVRGVWLTGSTARGTDDQFSDVDLLAVVLDEHFDAFAAGWPARAERIASTVYRNALDFGTTVVFPWPSAGKTTSSRPPDRRYSGRCSSN